MLYAERMILRGLAAVGDAGWTEEAFRLAMATEDAEKVAHALAHLIRNGDVAREQAADGAPGPVVRYTLTRRGRERADRLPERAF